MTPATLAKRAFLNRIELVGHRLLNLDAALKAAVAAAHASEWRAIGTAPSSTDHMHPILAYWVGRGVQQTYWDVDDDYDQRPSGWRSPECGWRCDGDQCIPVNQEDVTHWRPMPEPPAESGAGSPSEASASAPATDDLIPPGFVVAPREVVDAAREALKPFAKFNTSGFGCVVVEVVPASPNNPATRIEPILLSSFARAAEVFAALPPPGGGKDSSSTHPAARIASDHAATAPQCKSEEG